MSSSNQADIDAQNVERGVRLPRTARRAQLLAAALDVFVTNGYHATLMDEIADHAGVSKPILYQHFPGKMELYLALVERHANELVARVRTAMGSTTDNKLRVRAAVGVVFDFVEGVGQVFHIADLRGDSVQDVIERAWQDAFGTVVEIVTEGTHIGQGLTELLAAGLAGAVESIARLRIRNSHQISREEAEKLAAGLAWNIVSEFSLTPTEFTVHDSLTSTDNLIDHTAAIELDRLYSQAKAGDLRLVQHFVHASFTSSAANRTLPVSIYLESTSDSTVIEQAIRELLETSGFNIDKAKPPIVGSWFRLMLGRSKTALTSTEMIDAMTRIERAVEMQVLHKPQAEIDSAQVDAVAKVITSLESEPNAFIQVGSIFMIKVDGVVVVRNLSQRELAFLQRNSRMLASPREILRALEGFAQNEFISSKSVGDQDAGVAEGAPGDASLASALARGWQESDQVTIEDRSTRVTVSSPDDCGHVGIVLATRGETVTSYDVRFGLENGHRPIIIGSPGPRRIYADSDGTAVLRDHGLTVTVKRPAGSQRKIEMTLDSGDGKPTSYDLNFASG